MKFAALLGAIALIPVAFVIGYLAHQDPAPPSFGELMLSQGVKHVTGQDTDDWLAVAVTGPNKGGAMAVEMALVAFPTHKALEQSARGKVKYYELKCQNFSSGGEKNLYAASQVYRKCVSLVRTRKQAEKHMVDLLKPEPKS